MFATDELTVQYGAVKALDAVTVDCATRVVGIAGANGAGKSTVLNVFCGYVRPTSGRVYFRGTECTGSGPATMARLRGDRRTSLRSRRAAARRAALLDELEMSAWRNRDVNELPYSVQKLLDLARA